MAKLLSTPATITVANLPYSVPAAKTAVAIGVNVAADSRPAQHSVFDWSYATMENYGSGCFVESYSAAGAWVVAGTGGHGGAAMYGQLVFDFTTARWSYVHNANGLANRTGSLSSSEMNSNGEVTIGGVSGGMPAPAHVYGKLIEQPKAFGGGPKGSLLMVNGLYMDQAAMIGSNYAHSLDLSTALWTRYTSNTRSSVYKSYPAPWHDAQAAYDPVTGRIYDPPVQLAAVTQLPFIDLATRQWAVQNISQQPPGSQYGHFVDVSRRLLVFLNDGALRAYDLRTFALVTLATSGPVPSHRNRWTYYPVDGCWYSYSGRGQQIDRLQPPNAGAGGSGIWTFSTVTISGATLPAQANMTGAGNSHYTRFFYVPALQCFAWIAGVDHQVVLVKP
jgi:hypothetical protein